MWVLGLTANTASQRMSLAFDQDNSVYLSSLFLPKSLISASGKYETTVDSVVTGGLITSFDSNGIYRWAAKFDGDNLDYIQSLEVDETGVYAS